MENNSKKVAVAAIKMALTESREEEKTLKGILKTADIAAAAVDYGGDSLSCIPKVIERAVVAAKREGVIHGTHSEEGAVAGATHEALSQIISKALGLNVGGKVGIARQGDHISVCILFGVGLLHLNDVASGLAHRAISG